MAKKESALAKFDLRKIGIIFTIAVLFSIFVFTTIEAVYPRPNYDDFCEEKFYPERPAPIGVKGETITCPPYEEPSQELLNQCAKDKGFPEYERDANNCVTSYKGCNFCQRDFDDAREQHDFVSFLISTFFALVAIVIGLYLPEKKHKLNEWIGTGFMLGGIITLFFGTAMFFGELHRIVKPIVILFELILIIYIAYKKLGNK